MADGEEKARDRIPFRVPAAGDHFEVNEGGFGGPESLDAPWSGYHLLDQGVFFGVAGW